MKMPQISLEIINSTTVSIVEDRDFWNKATETLLHDNPLLYQLLSVSDYNAIKGPDFNQGYKKGSTLTYILLSRQVEAENMNEQWG